MSSRSAKGRRTTRHYEHLSTQSPAETTGACAYRQRCTPGIKLLFLSSHLVSIPPGPHLLSDMIINSPVLAADTGAGEVGDMPGGSGGPSNDFEFGVDPTLDPELAMVGLSCRDTFPSHVLTHSLRTGITAFNARGTGTAGCRGPRC